MPTPAPPTYSAAALAIAGGAGHPPTAEQAAVIEAPATPLLVVAGAGSGKTETMAARVVWLVANGYVEPDQVLGLTFTRKAASELAERVAQRLRRLRSAGLWAPAPDDEGAEVLGGTPTVSTYHAYAGRLVREHALRLGYEADASLLSEAAAWQVAAEAVYAYDGDMSVVTSAESTVIAAVVDLAGEMAEHLLGVEDVRRELDRVVAAIDATPAAANGKMPAAIAALRARMLARRAVLPIVDDFARRKRERDAVDFADQVALAARLARTFPDIGRAERDRFRTVLLDEFQDTSEAQLVLLRTLFAAAEPMAVTAVGDPHQSIYGWRGASATTLARFGEEFGSVDGPAPQLPLATSWRNDERILAVANVVAEPLRAAAGRVPVTRLRARDGAGTGDVAAARFGTHLEEAAYLARWLGEVRSREGVSAAVLCRKRSQFAPVVEALEQAGVPYEVVGLGGLLITPEVEDIVAALRVVADPTRGDALLRLLTGAMCRLGAADLDGLHTWSRQRQIVLRRQDRGELGLQLPGDPAERDEDEASDDPAALVELAPDAVDEPSLVEAIEYLPPPEWVGPEGQRIDPEALARMRALAAALKGLRALTGLPLADLAGEAERALGLDIEVLARPEYTPEAARAHLDAFADVAAGYSASAQRPTLEGFLAWLDAALAEERGLDKGQLEPSPDAVQVLTVHAAKGLEWDCVAIPGLAVGTFPAREHAVSARFGPQGWHVPDANDPGWAGGLSGVPYRLRGDAEGLPVLRYEGAADLKALDHRWKEFLAEGGRHAFAEERRLAYVAMTRARRRLLLTTAVWSTQQSLRVTSPFLQEVVAAADDLGVRVVRWDDLPGPESGSDKPVTDGEDEAIWWPQDPLSARREALSDAQAAVEAALAEVSGRAETAGGWVGEDDPDGLALATHLLLAERTAASMPTPLVVEVPRHLSASALVALAGDPARYALALRRPMPSPPALAARRGTAFHAWVEQHYGRAALVDLTDLPGSSDEEGAAGDEDLPRMKELFLASEWAARTPVAVELAVETVIDGIAVRGRLDAVFSRGDGGFTVVDWKTGAQPSGEEARLRAVQLGAYALTYARLQGLTPDAVDAAFYYAQTGRTVRPPLPGPAELLALLQTVPEAAGPAQSH